MNFCEKCAKSHFFPFKGLFIEGQNQSSWNQVSMTTQKHSHEFRHDIIRILNCWSQSSGASTSTTGSFLTYGEQVANFHLTVGPLLIHSHPNLTTTTTAAAAGDNKLHCDWHWKSSSRTLRTKYTETHTHTLEPKSIKKALKFPVHVTDRQTGRSVLPAASPILLFFLSLSAICCLKEKSNSEKQVSLALSLSFAACGPAPPACLSL